MNKEQVEELIKELEAMERQIDKVRIKIQKILLDVRTGALYKKFS